MTIETLEVGAFGSNCYVVWKDSQKAIVIDPGADAKLILSFMESQKLEAAAYYLTHGHVDHVSALSDMLAKKPAPVAIHPAEAEWMFGIWNRMPPFYPGAARHKGEEIPLSDGMELDHGGLVCRVIHTPGHTPGCVCFHFEKENALFTGDTLFAGSIGRTDFPMSDPRLMKQSLSKLKNLPPAVQIHPGHGPGSTIAEEIRSNFFLR